MAASQTVSAQQGGMRMREFTYETQGTNTYLVYTLTPGEIADSMSLGMLTNNKIPGLASALFTQMDEEKYIKYNVSSKISVSQFFSGAVNRKRLLGVFGGIVNALISAEDYMIDTNTILLDLDYIFADVTTCETVLICLPVEGAAQEYDLGAFFKEIMFATQFDQTENCDHVAKIINYLNSTPVFSLNDFKRVLDEIALSGQSQTGGTSQPGLSSGVIQEAPGRGDPSAAPGRSSPSPFAASGQAEIHGAGGNYGTQNPGQPSPQTVEQPGLGKSPQLSQNHGVRSPGAAAAYPGMNMPHSQPVQPVTPQSARGPAGTAGASEEKKISMLGLLMHYSKENKELYKAQRAEKKNMQVASKPAKKEKKKKKEITYQSEVYTAGPDFAIPGQTPPATGGGMPMGAQNAGLMSASAKKESRKKKNKKETQPPQPAAQQAASPQVPYSTAQPSYQGVTTQPVQPGPASQSPYPAAQPPYQGAQMNFGETTVLGGGGIGETTVLNEGQNPAQTAAPHLIRVKNNERIPLNKAVFRIGKERSFVDYFIGDNTAVSRSHANFITRDGEYFVVDTNSTNHTFVNGQMIQSNSEVKISPGDTIRLGNEDFEFKIY